MTKKINQFINNNSSNFIISLTSSLITVVLVFVLIFGLSWFGFISINPGSNSSGLGFISKPVATGTAAEQSQLIKTIDRANPAVVSIVITKTTQNNSQNYNPFFYFFGIPDNSNQNDSTEEEVGGGSGFFVSSDGYIITNNHVVSDDSAKYTIVTHDDKRYTAEILATDETFDVAVLKIKGNDFSYLSFANSKDIKVGQTVIAIGNALTEFQNTASTGIVSGLYRSITASDGTGSTEQLSEVIQTDAAINPGNSGGPLLDIKGNVIGVNTAIESNAQNIGFAIPSNIVNSIYSSVKKHGEIIKPYLGVRYVQIDETLAKKNNLSENYGVLITKGENSSELAIIPGSPADKAGIEENDIIVKVDGEKLDQNKSLASIIQQKSVGQTVTLEIIHDGKTKTVDVKLEKAPKN